MRSLEEGGPVARPSRFFVRAQRIVVGRCGVLRPARAEEAPRGEGARRGSARYTTTMRSSLLAIHVQVRVTPQSIDGFREATLANASASLQEPGVVRFDVLQDLEAPTRFVLVEVYRDARAAAAHKETAHYRTWRDAVAPMMAEPRSSRKFVNVFPPDDRW